MSASNGDPLFSSLRVLDSGPNANAGQPAAGQVDADISSQEIGCFRVPYGYELWGDGLFLIEDSMPKDTEPVTTSIRRPSPKARRKHLKTIARRPIWIAGQGATADTGQELIKLVFLPTDPQDGGRHEWVDRSQIAERRELTRLARVGLPVRTGNADRVEEYLDRAWHVNAGRLPRTLVAARSGAYRTGGDRWPQGTPDGWGWLVGDRWIGPPGTVLEPDPRGRHPLTRGLELRGDRSAWLAAARKIADHNLVCRWLLFSALAAPLLRFLRHRTFIVHHWSQSGAGKTSLLKFAMSTIGNPQALVGNFNRTELSFIEVFKYIDDLPIAFDELQARKKGLNVIYDLCQEKGRERAGEGGGLQQSIEGWRSVIRTTGEEPLIGIDHVDLGGQTSRVLELNAEALTSTEAEAIHRWLETEQSWGWGGQIFLEGLSCLLQAPGGEARLLGLHAEIADYVVAAAGASHVRASALATIATATVLGSRLWWGLDRASAREWARSDAVTIAGLMAVEDPSVLLVHERALQLFRDHRDSNRKYWIDAATPEGAHALATRSYSALFGIERAGVSRDECWLIQAEASHLLQKEGIPPNRVWPDLHRYGILRSGSDRLAAIRKHGGFKNRVYVLDQSKFDPSED